MKHLVVYSSKSGNTRKVAQAVFDALPSPKQIAAIGAAPDPQGYDFVAVGFWLMGGKPDPDAAAYLKKIGAQRLFLFATHGAAPDSEHARTAMTTAKELAPESTIVGTFNCQGEVDPTKLEKIKAKTPPPIWVQDADAAVGHPDENDLAAAKEAVAEALQN